MRLSILEGPEARQATLRGAAEADKLADQPSSGKEH